MLDHVQIQAIIESGGFDPSFWWDDEECLRADIDKAVADLQEIVRRLEG